MKQLLFLFLGAWAFLLVAAAEDFTLSGDGVGPISVHTQLTYEGRGERLVATARNDSGVTVSRVDLCVVAAAKGCLFTLWNTEPWEAGQTLEWNIVSPNKVSTLAHQIGIGGPPPAKVMSAPPSSTSSAPGLVKGGLFTRSARLYDLSSGEVAEVKFNNKWWAGHGKLSTATKAGDVFSGEFSTVPRGAIGWGAVFATTGETSGSASGLTGVMSGDQRGQAIMTDQNGTVVECEYLVSAYSGHGYGACKDNHAGTYKLMF